jgi:hypothetical protein
MTTFGDIMGRRRAHFGKDLPFEADALPVEPISAIFNPPTGGLDLSDAPEDIKPTGATLLLDMEVSRADRLIRAPGILQTHNEPQSLQYIFQQASLDYQVELVVIAPPWLGYKGAGAFSWVNLGLANTGLYGWAGMTYLGILLVSNGVDASYSRAAGAAVVTNESANVIARTFAQQFGRKFAGHFTSAGQTYSLGIKWDDTSGTIGGWGGAGSGSELLLAPDQDADFIVAVRALGYDVLAIVNRNSLFAGYPTGRDNRPADFRFRFGGVGGVHERNVRVTPAGVTFLSDAGVMNYNVNSIELISHQINAELLPLDYNNLPKYTAAYIHQSRRYYLATPNSLYIYEFPLPEFNIPGRWFKRSAVIQSIFSFSDQSASVTWDALVGSWDAQVQSWDTLGTPGWASPASVYFTTGTRLGKEDSALATWFGFNQTPKWRTPQMYRERTTDQSTTLGWEIIYSSQAASTIRMLTPDYNSDFNNSVDQVLPSTAGVVRRKILWAQQSGMGVMTQLEIIDGAPEILRIRQIIDPGGQVVEAL